MARYIPKSKVSILQTTGNEFVISSTNQPYQGSYMEVSNGTFFAGNNPQNPGKKLTRLKTLNINFGVSNNNSIYRKIKRPIYDELSKKVNIPISKVFPLEKDYERGYFIRYFCKRINDKYNYFEINKKTYNNLILKNNNYDYNLYNTGKIKWVLLETPYTIYEGGFTRNMIKDVSVINSLNIRLLLNEFPFLDVFFTNPIEYEPTHTRTLVDKLYYDSGTLYNGYFHQHPENGIMEGPYHSTKLHKKLFTQAQLGISTQITPQQSLPTYQQPSTPGTSGTGGSAQSSTPSPPSTGGSNSGGTSGGGGGGY